MATRVEGARIGLRSVMVGRPPACVQRHHCETCRLAMTTPGSAAAQPGPASPRCFPMCYGPEFVSRDLDLWAYQHGVVLDFSRPGKPTDNSFAEAFNGKVRAECIDQNWFLSRADARLKCEAFRH